MTVEDALMAVEAGVDAIVVSIMEEECLTVHQEHVKFYQNC